MSFFLILLFIVPCHSQQSPQVPLQEALLELAKSERLSIVFSTQNIPDKLVDIREKGKSVKQRLETLLKDTELYFELKDNQILLYRKNRLFGYIEDGKSGERLIAATLQNLQDGSFKISNNFGYYSLLTKSDTLVLEASYVGYETRQVVVSKEQMGKPLNIQLFPDNNIKEVLITDNLVSIDERKYIELDKGSDILLTQNQAITALGGEPDIFQAIVRQPGVSSGVDGIGGVHIRGGKNDQNMVLYDGVKIYNPAHTFGMFSVVSSSVVDQVRLHKSGASGASSGRLSSVIDVRLKEPSLNSVNTQFQFSTLAGQITTEFPLIKDKLGILVSGRNTYVDPYVNHITKNSFEGFEIDRTSEYGFYDLNLKLYGKLDNRNRLYMTMYQGRDRYADRSHQDLLDFEPAFFLNEDISYQWKNRLGSLRWNRLIGNSSFMNLQVSGYQYDYNNRYESDFYDELPQPAESYSQFITFNSQVSNYEIKFDMETILPRHHFKYGINTSQRDYQIGEVSDTLIESESGEFVKIDQSQLIPTQFLGYSNTEITLYFSDKMKVANDFLLEAGVYQIFHRTKDEDIAIEPLFGTSGYIKALKKLNTNIYVGGSIGSFIQTEHLLTTADNGYPNDIWVPSTDFVPFQRSNQIELFSEVSMGNHELGLSAYYKSQSGLLRYINYGRLPSLVDLFTEVWEFEVELGNSSGYGVELDYSFKMEDKIAIHSVYSYGVMDYEFPGVNNGEPFPFDYSIPHTISIGGNIKLSQNWRLVVDWFYSSGKPFTLYETFFEYSPLDINGVDDDTVLSGENELRQPEVHKLSMMISTKWKWSGIKNNLSFGAQNMYNRRNAILQYRIEGEGIQSQYGFPILPMFLWRIEF